MRTARTLPSLDSLIVKAVVVKKEDEELCVTCISCEISLSCLCWLLVLQSSELSPLKTITVIMYYDYIFEIEMLIFCRGNYHSKCTFYIMLNFLH